jgi:hypothetical protein
MNTNKPLVEDEKEEGKEVYDITVPLHDAAGKVIGTVGLDVKPEANQKESEVLELAGKLSAKWKRRSRPKPSCLSLLR